MTDERAWQNRIVGHGEESPENLTANPRNWRIHPEMQQQALAGVLDEVGWVQQIVVNRGTGYVVDGHLRVLLAMQREEPMVPVTYVDLSAEEEALVLATLDPLAAMAATDSEKLAEILADIGEREGAVGSLLADLTPDTPNVGRTDPDDVPEPPKKPTTKPGDLWTLGNHRLLCGDASEKVDLDRLYADGAEADCILTDPPYGIDLDTDYRKMGEGIAGAPPNLYRNVIGDDVAFDARDLRAYFGAREQFWFGADYYRQSLSGDDRDGSWLVWDKRSEFTDTGFGSGFELIWSAERHKREVLRVHWFGPFGPSDAKRRLHPTQKPVDLLATILTRWTKPDAVVADPFLGSGTTLIACEREGRRCAGMEIDPAYCDVIVERWENFTGGKAERE